jgi:hypothetical protein
MSLFNPCVDRVEMFLIKTGVAASRLGRPRLQRPGRSCSTCVPAAPPHARTVDKVDAFMAEHFSATPSALRQQAGTARAA